MAKRNYIRDAHAVGRTYKQIAKELHVSPATVSSYARGKTTPKHSYEQLRNVYRRSTYRAMREAGYSSSQATASRRDKPTSILYDVDWLSNTVDNLYREWNKHHPDPSDPKHMSKALIRRILQKGLDSGKSKEEIERDYN